MLYFDTAFRHSLSVVRIGGCMKKFMLLGMITGVTVAAIILYLRRKELEGTEFKEFFDSSTVADDLFGDAFQELPDKI